MTRKDYEMIAQAIADATFGTSKPADAAVETAERIAEFIADGLKADNPAFDRKRFMAACGFSN